MAFEFLSDRFHNLKINQYLHEVFIQFTYHAIDIIKLTLLLVKNVISNIFYLI